MRLKHLFSPIKIKSMELKNRIVMPPMGTFMANADGSASDRLIDYHEARAKGGAALLTVEVTAVHPSCAFGMGEIGVAALYDDKFVPGWKRFTEHIHAAGAKTSIQLWHPGRQMPPLGPDKPPWAPSPLPCPMVLAPPHVMTASEIEEMIESFAQAAFRAKEAGFDAVEIHGAHGYLIAQFMSAYSNRRTDRYGGDLGSRMRFALEVLQASRAKVGPAFPIVFRLSADERVPGGIHLEESLAMAPLLVAAGADCLSVSTGVYATGQYTVAPVYAPKGLNVQAAQQIKKAVNVPVIAVGKLNDPLMAEEVIASGKADLVAIGRGLYADPELPNKAAAGQFEDIRWCTACIQGCITALMESFSTRCLVNPEVGRERQMAIAPAAKSKRVLVIGGGPAGMEAAKVAAQRGHDVTLYEKDAELGGQYRIASIPPAKQEIIPYIRYQARQLDKSGVKVVMGQQATAATVDALKPDVVVVAAGSSPVIPDIPGANGENVVTGHDVLTFRVQTGSRVLIAGGGSVGCEIADFLASYGKNVTVVDMLPDVATDMPVGSKFFLMERLAQQKVKIVTSAAIREILSNGVLVSRDGKEETIGGMDTVVLALGTKSRNELAGEIEGTVGELYVIGDARTPGKAMDAIAAGAEVGRQI
ncbi:MAG: FAD-dependent oxidoreductase [Deltaproteobacteria bacterium]|nr:FAD-dependent oxidoreductase [Deltaproteobacteria bacterium]